MKVDPNNTCKVLIKQPTITNAYRKNHPYFMSLRHRSMMKMKVPKLLLKKMRITRDGCRDKDRDDNDGDDDSHGSKKKDKSENARKILHDKVGSIFSDVFRFKRCRQSGASSSNSSGNGIRVHENDQCSPGSSSLQGDLSASSRKIDTSNIKSMSPSGVDGEENESKEDEKKSISLKEVIQVEDDQQSELKDESFTTGSLTDLSIFLSRKNSFKFIKGNINGKVVRQERSTRKIVKKKVGDKVQEDGEADDYELCKKRILMGEKCRPLNLSGTLHYDKDGIILPELLK